VLGAGPRYCTSARALHKRAAASFARLSVFGSPYLALRIWLSVFGSPYSGRAIKTKSHLISTTCFYLMFDTCILLYIPQNTFHRPDHCSSSHRQALLTSYQARTLYNIPFINIANRHTQLYSLPWPVTGLMEQIYERGSLALFKTSTEYLVVVEAHAAGARPFPLIQPLLYFYGSDSNERTDLGEYRVGNDLYQIQVTIAYIFARPCCVVNFWL
jgi:hypothetical protein